MSSPSHKSTHRSTRSSPIVNLPDDLLLQILIQLPWEDAVQCMTVCRRWYYLIIDHGFALLSIHSHHQFNSSSSIWIRYIRNNNNSTLPTYQLNYLRINPSNQLVEARGRIIRHVVAYFNDLILIRCAGSYKLQNPRTGLWLLLPLPPPTHDQYFEGFVCYPCSCSVSEACTSTSNAKYRFKVARIHFSKVYGHGLHVKVKIDIFCSKSYKWTELLVSSPQPLGGHDNNIAAYNGILHWMDEQGRVVAYDPSNNLESCRVIDSPTNFVRPFLERGKVFNRIGVSGGSLQVSQIRLAPLDLDKDTILSIWKLEDYTAGKWGCERKLKLKDTISNDSWLSLTVAKSPVYANVIGFHPHDVNIAYLCFLGGRIVSCNIITRTLQLIDHIHDLSWQYGYVISLLHPWCPTPVPPLLPNHPQAFNY